MGIPVWMWATSKNLVCLISQDVAKALKKLTAMSVTTYLHRMVTNMVCFVRWLLVRFTHRIKGFLLDLTKLSVVLFFEMFACFCSYWLLMKSDILGICFLLVRALEAGPLPLALFTFPLQTTLSSFLSTICLVQAHFHHTFRGALLPQALTCLSIFIN